MTKTIKLPVDNQNNTSTAEVLQCLGIKIHLTTDTHYHVELPEGWKVGTYAYAVTADIVKISSEARAKLLNPLGLSVLHDHNDNEHAYIFEAEGFRPFLQFMRLRELESTLPEITPVQKKPVAKASEQKQDNTDVHGEGTYCYVRGQIKHESVSL